MSAITHWLNSLLNVWRETLVSDGAGGFTSTWANQGSVSVKIDQSTGTERLAAQQAGSDHTHNLYFDPDEDIRRNDRLADDGVDPNTDSGPWYEIDATTTPSTPRYLKAQSVRVESA